MSERPVITHNAPWRGQMTKARRRYREALHSGKAWQERRRWHLEWIDYGRSLLQDYGSDRARHENEPWHIGEPYDYRDGKP